MSELERGGINISQCAQPYPFGTLLDATKAEEQEKKKRNEKYAAIRKEIMNPNPLSWNVYMEDFNRNVIMTRNILDNRYFRDDCRKAARLHKQDKEAFSESVKGHLMYYYWSKCEYEIILTAWPPRENFNDKKIDIYDQVMLNWDRFIDYLWEHRKEL